MKTNLKAKVEVPYTHEGFRATMHLTPEQQMRRTIMSCMLWENNFYEDGESVTDRIKSLATKLSPEYLSELAIEVRNESHLRHAPLWLLTALIEQGRDNPIVSKTIYKVIQRPDELAELLSLYWLNGKKPLSAQLKKGLASAFTKFDAYSLAKYNRDNAIKLRDVMFMCHPKPKNEEQELVFKKLANKELESPDTWEVALSAGADKKETFTRLLKENKLGYLALLRNLRNMIEADVPSELVRDALRDISKAKNILPFRFVAAAKAAPFYEEVLDTAMVASIAELPMLSGTTVVLVDVSNSMNDSLSEKSDMTRMIAAATLASIVKSEELRVFTFSDELAEVPANRRGMSGVDAVIHSQRHRYTYLVNALKLLYQQVSNMDRLIVITDEQISNDPNNNTVPILDNVKSYMINVASYKNGIGYGKWLHIDGFSENVIKYIYELEQDIRNDN